MQRLLLDTQALLLALADDPELAPSARSAIADPANEVFVSAVSIWEIAIKHALGKLRAPGGIATLVEESGFQELVVTSFHAEQAGGLPMHHRDPLRQDARCPGPGGRTHHRDFRPPHSSIWCAYYRDLSQSTPQRSVLVAGSVLGPIHVKPQSSVDTIHSSGIEGLGVPPPTLD